MIRFLIGMIRLLTLLSLMAVVLAVSLVFFLPAMLLMYLSAWHEPGPDSYF